MINLKKDDCYLQKKNSGAYFENKMKYKSQKTLQQKSLSLPRHFSNIKVDKTSIDPLSERLFAEEEFIKVPYKFPAQLSVP